jgi:SAM-dependent methyltransferase
VETAGPASPQDDLRPPEELVHVGPGDFTRTGQGLVEYLVRRGGLEPHWSVLDVGCGIGRVAVALAGYLRPTARYEGFDVVAEGIAWCDANITPRYPNFTFRHVDLYNGRYNPTGKLKANEFEFPYEADQFDFVLLSSVFTHMLPDDMDHYVSEIRRVTKPGGRCVATFYLLNEESVGSLEAGTSRIDIDHDYGTHRVRKAETPEGVIAYREEFVIDMLQRHGFHPGQIDYGKWVGPGRSPEGRIYLDAVIADLSA